LPRASVGINPALPEIQRKLSFLRKKIGKFKKVETYIFQILGFKNLHPKNLLLPALIKPGLSTTEQAHNR